MSKKTAVAKEAPIADPLEPGDIVWVLWGNKYWPSRIAEPEEVTESERAMKKTRDYLVHFFGEGNYDWVKASTCFTWNEDDENKIKTNKKVFASALPAAKAWEQTPVGERVFPRPTPKSKKEVPKVAKTQPKAAPKRKREENDDATASAPPPKKVKRAEGVALVPKVNEKDVKPGKPSEESHAPVRRRKLDLLPERNPKPTPDYKIVNGKAFKDLSKEDKEAVEKRRVKRRALMRELALWPPKGTMFPAE